MIYESLNENCAFFYSEDLELLLAVHSLLRGEPVHKLCTQAYGTERIAALQKKYRFLFELFHSLGRYYDTGMFEFLVSYPLEQFTLPAYRDYLQNMDTMEFIRRHMDMDEENFCKMREALEGKRDAEDFYGGDECYFKNYLGMQIFFAHAKRYAAEYCDLAEELRTDAFHRMLEEAKLRMAQVFEKLRKGLLEMDPMQYSEQAMGKGFSNRGPYGMYYFSASLFMPYRVLRMFSENQLLLVTLRKITPSDEDIVTKLKAIADPTPLNIMTLLGEKGSLREIDIAAMLNLTPAEVTEEMQRLQSASLVIEEVVQKEKHYTISKYGLKELIGRLSKALGRSS